MRLFHDLPLLDRPRPGRGALHGVFAWVVDKGSIDGIDVSGRIVVSVSTHEGHRDTAQQRVILFVDEDASDGQASALAAAFSGCMGGPLGELATILGELLEIRRAEIRVEFDGRRAALTVGRILASESSTLVGATGKVTTLSDARLSGVLGSPAEVGMASRFKVGMPGHGMDLELRGRSAMRGAFRYQNNPGSHK